MINYIVYSLLTGEIHQSGCTTLEQDALAHQSDIYGVVIHLFDSVLPATHYYDIANEVILLRPTIELNITKNSSYDFIINNLPIPCTIEVNNEIYDVLDGNFEFTANVVGTYTLTVKAFPYITKICEIQVI